MAADPSTHFIKHERIGKGSFGSVYKGVDKRTNKIVAIKILNVDSDSDEVEAVQAELAVLSQCHHNRIVGFHGSFIQPSPPRLWIIMDFCGGGSIRQLMRAGPIEEKYLAVIAREVLHGLAYLHGSNIIHRDIKAANVLLTDLGELKLCDFGVSGTITVNAARRTSFVGTPCWMAPEVIMHDRYDYKADIWSFGITIFEMATGDAPMAALDPMAALQAIPRVPPPRLDSEFSKSLREFVRAALQSFPEDRPTALEMLKYSFIKGAKKNPLILRDLITRYDRFVASNGSDDGSDDDADDAPTHTSRASRASRRSEVPNWDFDTFDGRAAAANDDDDDDDDVADGGSTVRGGYRTSASAGAVRTAGGTVVANEAAARRIAESVTAAAGAARSPSSPSSSSSSAMAPPAGRRASFDVSSQPRKMSLDASRIGIGARRRSVDSAAASAAAALALFGGLPPLRIDSRYSSQDSLNSGDSLSDHPLYRRGGSAGGSDGGGGGGGGGGGSLLSSDSEDEGRRTPLTASARERWRPMQPVIEASSSAENLQESSRENVHEMAVASRPPSVIVHATDSQPELPVVLVDGETARPSPPPSPARQSPREALREEASAAAPPAHQSPREALREEQTAAVPPPVGRKPSFDGTEPLRPSEAAMAANLPRVVRSPSDDGALAAMAGAPVGPPPPGASHARSHSPAYIEVRGRGRQVNPALSMIREELSDGGSPSSSAASSPLVVERPPDHALGAIAMIQAGTARQVAARASPPSPLLPPSTATPTMTAAAAAAADDVANRIASPPPPPPKVRKMSDPPPMLRSSPLAGRRVDAAELESHAWQSDPTLARTGERPPMQPLQPRKSLDVLVGASIPGASPLFMRRHPDGSTAPQQRSPPQPPADDPSASPPTARVPGASGADVAQDLTESAGKLLAMLDNLELNLHRLNIERFAMASAPTTAVSPRLGAMHID